MIIVWLPFPIQRMLLLTSIGDSPMENDSKFKNVQNRLLLELVSQVMHMSDNEASITIFLLSLSRKNRYSKTSK